jgi:hypothetical protein
MGHVLKWINASVRQANAAKVEPRVRRGELWRKLFCIQLNHEWTRRNTPKNARFIMSPKGADADDVGLSPDLGFELSALNSKLSAPIVRHAADLF